MEANLQKTEINANINIPNLSKEAEGFLCRIAAPALIAGSEFLTTKFRAATFNAICELSNKYAEQLGVDIKPTPPKFLLPFIEKASLEDDVDLQKEWAKLLVAAGKEYNSIHSQYTEILSQISGNEARLLKEIYMKQKDMPYAGYNLLQDYEKAVVYSTINGDVSRSNKFTFSDFPPLNGFRFPKIITFEIIEYCEKDNISKTLLLLQRLNLIKYHYFHEHKSDFVLTPYNWSKAKVSFC